jgi:hypothetical protein
MGHQESRTPHQQTGRLDAYSCEKTKMEQSEKGVCGIQM